jgi:Protein of unknown function (DUF2795)
VERGSDKHGPRMDDALKHDVEGAIRGTHSTHAEEWKDPEPSAEDQPDVDMAPDGTLTGGTPPGMTPEDVETRAQLAAYLGKEVYPAERDELVTVVRGRQAPDRLVELVSSLPTGRRFDNVNDVAEALGIGVERGRY